MSKKSKSQKSNGAASPATATNGSPTEATAQPKKQRKAAPKPARKPAAKKSTKKTASAKQVRSTPGAGPTDADIRIRAYFIAEQRARLALPGDSSNDWLEARRQLMAEAAAGQS